MVVSISNVVISDSVVVCVTGFSDAGVVVVIGVSDVVVSDSVSELFGLRFESFCFYMTFFDFLGTLGGLLLLIFNLDILQESISNFSMGSFGSEDSNSVRRERA